MAKSGVGATRDPLWYCVETYEWRQFGEEVKFVWLSAINKGIDKVIEITCSGQDGKLCDSLLKVEAGHFFALRGVRQSQSARDVCISTASGCTVSRPTRPGGYYVSLRSGKFGALGVCMIMNYF